MTVDLTDLLAAPAPHLADADAELRAALTQTVIAPLPDHAVLRIQGPDTEAFLQGQLSSDLRKLAPGQAQWSSWSSAKGRVVVVLTLLRDGSGVLMELPRTLLAPTLKRLRLFVLRGKVTIEDAGLAQLGLAGPQAATRLQAAGLPAPAAPNEVATADGLWVLRRHGDIPRFCVLGTPAALQAHWPALNADIDVVGGGIWPLLDILAGVPAVLPETQEHFVAQMLNLDTLGGISFDKGCYTGQEVIARLHYLGTLKRRMFRLRTTEAAPVAPGTPILSAGGDGQSVGEVVCAARHPGHGQDLLAVLQLSQAEAADLRLGSLQGPALGRPEALVT